MLKRKIVLVVVFFVLATKFSFSQIGVSQLTGCAPLLVSFTAPPGATSASWNFSNGTATGLSVSNIFSTPGTYQVSYSGVGGSPTSGVVQIVVSPNNVSPSFTYLIPPSHCAPMTVSFSGTGPTGGNYQWFFGDGGTASGSSVNYAYSLMGIFTATLNVTDPVSGCMGTISNGPFNVSNPPNLNILPLPSASSCTVPFSPSFSGNLSTTGSPLGGGLTYSWNFGNSQTSTLQNPGVINYNQQGYYLVVLTATDNNFCTGSISEVITAIQPTLTTTVPATICIAGQQSYSGFDMPGLSVQSSQPFTTWQMGDGNTIIVPPPPSVLTPNTPTTVIYQHYTTPGLKTLTITATQGACVVTQTKTIFVVQVVPQFTFSSPSFTCMPSMQAGFINTSSVNFNVPMYSTWVIPGWNGMLYTSTATNPTITVTVGSLNPYAYYGMYIVQPALTINTGPQGIGCGAILQQRTDTIWRPTAWFTKSVREGCAPLVVKFRDSSNIASLSSSRYPMTSYTWNNGATPPTIISGNIPPPLIHPTFTYSTAGVYTPSYSITTMGGCSAVSFVDTIIVVDPPTISAPLLPKLNYCVGEPVTFSMTSAPNSTVIQHWHAETDNGFFSGCVNDSMPTWSFTHPGVQTLTMSAWRHSCKSSMVSSQVFTVSGPVARVRYQTNCTNKTSIIFSSFLQEVVTATLNFGDNSSPRIIPGSPTGIVSDLVTHVYPAGGNYTATIIGINPGSGCAAYNYSVLVTVRDAAASFTITNPLICRGELLTVSASTLDVLVTCIRGYAWALDTLEPVQRILPNYSITTLSSLSGTHTVKLWVKDANSCSSTAIQTFTIASPTASFIVKSPACINDMPLTFTNVTSQSPIAANNFTWSFGTGPIVTTTNVSIWPTHSYNPNTPGLSYLVTMTAQSAVSTCKDVFTKIVEVINPPEAYLYPYKYAPCVNEPVSFNTPPGITYSVNFGDGSAVLVSSVTPISHIYTVPGTYQPVLSVGAGGCINVANSPNTIVVYAIPPSNFTYSLIPAPGSTLAPVISPSVVCAIAEVRFTSTSSPTTGLGFTWNFVGATGPLINSYTIANTYNTSGTKTITLKTFPAQNSNCFAMQTKTFTVLDPKAKLVIDKPKFCIGETVRLSLQDTSNVAGWIWVRNGITDTVFANSSPANTIAYTYTNYPTPFGSGNITLLYFGSGFKCPRSAGVGIDVIKIDPDFNRNLELSGTDSVHCLKITDYFNNKTKYNNSTNVSNLNFTWDFGNGAGSSTLSPSYTFTNAGIYSVTLTVKDPTWNCMNKTVKNMTINPIPDVSIFAVDSVCRGTDVVLTSITSTDVTQYQWLPVSGLLSTTTASTIVKTTISMNYSLDVVNVFGCKNTSAGQHIYVEQPLVGITSATTIIIGQTAQFNTYLGSNYTYTWSPVTDLSCNNCINPTSTSTVNITYSVVIEDAMGCFRTTSVYKLIVDPQTSIDVPTAFTPNGDGINDVIYVDGWGIKKLNYFRIFNRWGQLLFESNDIKIGWDGVYHGVPQNMETYVYQVSAEGYVPGKLIEKASSFRLIR